MKDLETRREEFKKSVLNAGGAIYTKQMIDEFVDYWTEANRARPPKMRWELQKTWEVPRRLRTWAKKVRGYPCYLTDAERSLQTRRRAFAIELEVHLPTYGKDLLNDFFRYWAQPDQKKMYLRWETENFWDLPTRLQQWKKKNESNIVNPMMR